MADHPLEVLLRPPVELWSGTVALSAGIICGTAPSTLMMTPSVGYTSAAILAGLGLYRLNQALKFSSISVTSNGSRDLRCRLHRYLVTEIISTSGRASSGGRSIPSDLKTPCHRLPKDTWSPPRSTLQSGSSRETLRTPNYRRSRN